MTHIVYMATKWIDYFFGAAMAGLLLVTTITTLLICVLPGRATDTLPTVVTPHGSYKGLVKELPDNSSVLRFAGIPFAQPPVGELRFLRPQPIQTKPSDEVIDARKMKKSCWSITKKSPSPYYGEDCLYLNVYVPNDKKNGIESYPVMVWIHGGGFVAGSVFPEPWSIVSRGQVIVVAVNYRLGPFGFLSTGDEALPANNGLWDQVAAMEWVKKNIEFFGGDRYSITIFGESAGAMSIALLALSPVSSSLFHKAIFQSGAANSALRRNPTIVAKEFAQNVGCKGFSDTTELASCLRNVSVESILQYSRPTNMNLAQRQVDFTWMPSIDGFLIPDDPLNILNNETYLENIGAFDKDYMFGFNNNEGSLLTNNFLNPIPDTTIQNITFFQDLADYLLTTRYDVPRDKVWNISDVVITYYTGLPIPEIPEKEAVMAFMADAMFYAPGIAMAKSLAHCNTDLINANISHSLKKPECENAAGKTYMYYFDFCPPMPEKPTTKCMEHGFDLMYEFPKRKFANDQLQRMSDLFIDLLTAFAKTSQPESVVDSGFPEYETASQYYLNLSLYPSVRQHLHQYRMNLWMRTIPKLLEESMSA